MFPKSELLTDFIEYYSESDIVYYVGEEKEKENRHHSLIVRLLLIKLFNILPLEQVEYILLIIGKILDHRFTNDYEQVELRHTVEELYINETDIFNTCPTNVYKQLKILDMGNVVLDYEKYFKISNLRNLKEIKLPQGMKKIKKFFASGCVNLKSVVIPKGVAVIETRAFEHCVSLISVIIPTSVNCIAHYAFENCASLEFIDLNKNIHKIGDGAFNECYALKEVITHGFKQLKTIGIDVFSVCHPSLEVHIPEHIVPKSVKC